MSSFLIYFNFCLIKCIKELMCWISAFKMTFTQLFLNALGKFLNMIVLLEEEKKHTVTMTFTERGIIT